MNSIDYSVNMGHNDFRTQIMTVEDLLYRFDETDATNSVSLFRRPTVAQSSRIIESVLLGMPQPMLYIDDTNSEWIVIEGAEHMFAYYSFCRKDMKLSSLYFKMNQYEGQRFYELSPLAQSNILNTKITVNVVNPGLTPHERFGIYMCLKTRIDATSLYWCRSKIFKNEYQWVRDLAKEVSGQKRTESLENIICYMLVGCYYKSFLNSSGRNHIDAVANRLLEKVYGEHLETTMYGDFKTVLNAYMTFPKKYVAQPKAIGVYLSVFYHLYKLRGNLSDIKRWNVHLEMRPKLLFRTDDSAEVFCESVDDILNRMK